MQKRVFFCTPRKGGGNRKCGCETFFLTTVLSLPLFDSCQSPPTYISSRLHRHSSDIVTYFVSIVYALPESRAVVEFAPPLNAVMRYPPPPFLRRRKSYAGSNYKEEDPLAQKEEEEARRRRSCKKEEPNNTSFLFHLRQRLSNRRRNVRGGLLPPPCLEPTAADVRRIPFSYTSRKKKKKRRQLYSTTVAGPLSWLQHACTSSEVSVTDTPLLLRLSTQLGTEGIECHTVNPRNPDMPPPPPDSEGRDGENT